MATVKTAISLPEDLFEQLQSLATEECTSRSAIVARAIEDFLRKREAQEMLRRLNEVYAEPLDAEEKAWIRHTSGRMGERLREDKW